MSVATANRAARAFPKDALTQAASSPSSFARQHEIEVADAIAIISRENRLRSIHKIWRK